MSEADSQKNLAISPDSFNRLLRWLDSGGDSRGQKYEEMRQRLILYFAHKNCPAPEDLADETFSRVMKWLERNYRDGDPNPTRIFYHTARFVFLEWLRAPRRASDIDDLPLSQQPSEDTVAEQISRERGLDCMGRCIKKLPAGDRDLISQYYSGEKRAKLDNRKALAAAHGLTPNALSIRAHRIRQALHDCVANCIGESSKH